MGMSASQQWLVASKQIQQNNDKKVEKKEKTNDSKKNTNDSNKRTKIIKDINVKELLNIQDNTKPNNIQNEQEINMNAQ